MRQPFAAVEATESLRTIDPIAAFTAFHLHRQIELANQLAVAEVDVANQGFYRRLFDAQPVAQDCGHRERRQRQPLDWPLQPIHLAAEIGAVPLGCPRRAAGSVPGTLNRS